MEENEKMTIEFSHTDRHDNKYHLCTTAETYPDLGETDLDFFGDQFNVFLRQCGYIRHHDHIFMSDVTEEEREALADFLEDLRSDNKAEGEAHD